MGRMGLQCLTIEGGGAQGRLPGGGVLCGPNSAVHLTEATVEELQRARLFEHILEHLDTFSRDRDICINGLSLFWALLVDGERGPCSPSRASNTSGRAMTHEGLF